MNTEPAQQEQPTPVATQAIEPRRNSVAMDTKLGAGLVVRPQTMGELIEFAKMIAYSGMVPECYAGNPGAIIVGMQMGAELGLSPMAALQNIAVINGRPSLWGDAGLAIVRTHKDFVDIEEIEGEGWAKCTLQRRGQSPVTKSFTVENAKLAKLWGKRGPWQDYPQRMLQMRARWFAMRDLFPDALRGISSAEEASDMPTTPWPAPIGAASPAVKLVANEDAKPEPKKLDPELLAGLRAFEVLGVSAAMIEAKFGQLDQVPLDYLRDIYSQVKQNPKRKAELFGTPPSAAAAINQRFGGEHAPMPEIDEQALADAARAAEAAQ